jgi:hypothetical protein
MGRGGELGANRSRDRGRSTQALVSVRLTSKRSDRVDGEVHGEARLAGVDEISEGYFRIMAERCFER